MLILKRRSCIRDLKFSLQPITHSVHIRDSFPISKRPTEPSYITLVFRAASCLWFSSISLAPARWKRSGSSLACQQGRLLTCHTKFQAGILWAGNQNPPAVCSEPTVCGRVLLGNHEGFKRNHGLREMDRQLCLLQRINEDDEDDEDDETLLQSILLNCR